LLDQNGVAVCTFSIPLNRTNYKTRANFGSSLFIKSGEQYTIAFTSVADDCHGFNTIVNYQDINAASLTNKTYTLNGKSWNFIYNTFYSGATYFNFIYSQPIQSIDSVINSEGEVLQSSLSYGDYGENVISVSVPSTLTPITITATDYQNNKISTSFTPKSISSFFDTPSFINEKYLQITTLAEFDSCTYSVNGGSTNTLAVSTSYGSTRIDLSSYTLSETNTIVFTVLLNGTAYTQTNTFVYTISELDITVAQDVNNACKVYYTYAGAIPLTKYVITTDYLLSAKTGSLASREGFASITYQTANTLTIATGSFTVGGETYLFNDTTYDVTYLQTNQLSGYIYLSFNLSTKVYEWLFRTDSLESFDALSNVYLIYKAKIAYGSTTSLDVDVFDFVPYVVVPSDTCGFSIKFYDKVANSFVFSGIAAQSVASVYHTVSAYTSSGAPLAPGELTTDSSYYLKIYTEDLIS